MARSDMTVELTLTDAAKMLIAEAREQLELNDKERAVIEAAKVFVAHDSPGGHRSMTDYSRLQLAVGALLAAEGGEE